jgi:hypothetical protein
MNITYVIGAGASAEIGMPVGATLKKHISAFLSNDPAEKRKYYREEQIVFGDKAIVRYFQYIRPGVLQKHHLDLMPEMLHALAADISIDNFLYTHKDNEAYQIFGKIAIFTAILKAEQSSLLWTFPNNLKYISILENTWYLSLFRQLFRQATLNQFIQRLKEIQFITFNYDRSLEFYLYWSIQRYYEISEEKAAEIMNNAYIYHPYGQVGFLPYQNGPLTFDYGTFQTYTENNLSKYIKTYTEGTDSKEKSYRKAMYNLYESEKVIFLGFAFHKQNIDLLFKIFNEWKSEYKTTHRETMITSNYYATFYETSDFNIKEIQEQIKKTNDHISSINICKNKCCDLFNEYSKVLEMF